MRTFVIVSLWRLVAGFSNQHYRLILLLIWFLILHEIIIQIAVGWCKWTRGFCRDKAIALQLKGHYYLLVFCDASWLTFRFYFWTADSLLSATEATLVLYRFALESFLNFSSLSTLGILPSNIQTFVTRPLGVACPESSLLRAEVCYCCNSKLLWSYQWLLL